LTRGKREVERILRSQIKVFMKKKIEFKDVFICSISLKFIFYAAQLTIAIGYLHMKGIAHRDLKLENILLDQNGYLKIIDFGLAKMLSDGEQAASFCGTPEYLAPEMIA